MMDLGFVSLSSHFLRLMPRPEAVTIPVVATDEVNIERLQNISVAIAIGIPFVIMGVLTGFHPGQSTKPERVWIMVWLIFGGFFGWQVPATLDELLCCFQHIDGRVVLIAFLTIFIALMGGVGTIGGLVMVGKMLKEYGNCIRLG